MGEKISELSFYDRVNLARSEFSVEKKRYNKFGDFYYRNTDDILSKAKEINIKYGLILKITDELVQVGDYLALKATVELQDTVECGVNRLSIYANAYAGIDLDKSKMDRAQILGSCSTYARKYALNAIYCIDDEVDPDSLDNKKPTASNAEPSSAPKRMTPHEYDVFSKKIDEIGLTSEFLCKIYNVTSLKELTMQQASAIIKRSSDALETQKEFFKRDRRG